MKRKLDIEEYYSSKIPRVETIKFYGYQHPLSNFYLASFCDKDGICYRSSEHFYQAMKTTDPAVRSAILKSRLPAVAKRMGSHIPIRDDWNDIKLDIMMSALRYKFSQNEELKRYLLNTRDKILVEDSPYDSFWGRGRDGTGLNHLGQCLMRLRDELFN